MRRCHCEMLLRRCVQQPGNLQGRDQGGTQSVYGYRKFDCLANLHSCHPDPTNSTGGSNILGRVSLDEQQISPATRLNGTSICEATVCSRQDCGRTQCFHSRQPCLDKQP